MCVSNGAKCKEGNEKDKEKPSCVYWLKSEKEKSSNVRLKARNRG